MIVEIFYYIVAAFFEILGCYMFWVVFKDDKSFIYLGLGVASLIVFAFILTRVESEFAGRAYAAYEGLYIISSLLWLFFVEKQSVNKYDTLGLFLCVSGALVIISGIFKKSF
ncbi:UPF0060 membrane protein [Campylobacter ureolyticus]|uniref:YnfA family protein n=1 Tax=Campylobacter ureolyticus TaxID=827 RepID=UPI001FC8A627|nr:YnfA family protein [Campylobacter ureolyticus]GKH61260.1 UPF0060 membrane protein [Campylobacter ureolyticus]